MSEIRSTVRNAKILSTHLGVEDHNIMSAVLQLDYGGACQGFGGWSLDTPKKDREGRFVKRVGTAFGMEFVMQILQTLEVAIWEKLPGTYCRAQILGHHVHAIGHITKDKWFVPDLLAKEYENE